MIDESIVRDALAKLTQSDVITRIWRKDHTVWKPDPREITDRLGWLTVTDFTRDHLPELKLFAEEVRGAGFRHIVLLGMGGSSLGAEVLRQVFGSAPGFPQLIVLDSTLPESIGAVTEATDPRRTLFLVSSKSGTTTEPLILYRYFRSLVEKAGIDSAGTHFVAITDPATPLVRMAEAEKFRRIFLNPVDIGGRYSVLSYFGMAPAALIGVDIRAILEHVDAMREGCAAGMPVPDNPGSWLGACTATMSLKGRDKLTLLTSPSLSSFGLWVEQLIAESTGKEGKGIIPVAGEPVLGPESYGGDRLFIYFRLRDDDNLPTDTAIASLEKAGHPAVVLDMEGKPALGAEFYRWEFATAVAGALLGVNPFDQPDVQRAKAATERILKEYAASRKPPEPYSTGTLADLLEKTEPGDYFAILAYVRQTPETDAALAGLRQRVMSRYRVATTLGYGPRFLHSTGQLHKGGPDKGLFLQITTDHEEDVPVPGEPYTFGTVADAQALGDLQVLQAAGRRVVSLRFKDVRDAMEQMMREPD